MSVLFIAIVMVSCFVLGVRTPKMVQAYHAHRLEAAKVTVWNEGLYILDEGEFKEFQSCRSVARYNQSKKLNDLAGWDYL